MKEALSLGRAGVNGDRASSWCRTQPLTVVGVVSPFRLISLSRTMASLGVFVSFTPEICSFEPSFRGSVNVQPGKACCQAIRPSTGSAERAQVRCSQGGPVGGRCSAISAALPAPVSGRGPSYRAIGSYPAARSTGSSSRTRTRPLSIGRPGANSPRPPGTHRDCFRRLLLTEKPSHKITARAWPEAQCWRAAAPRRSAPSIRIDRLQLPFGVD